MQKYNLCFDQDVCACEGRGDFRSAAVLAYDLWKKDQMDLNALLCAGTYLWYARLLHEYFLDAPVPPANISMLPEAEMESKLEEVTVWGLRHFGDEPAFNSYFGYMFHAKPYYFRSYNGDYDGWRAKGIAMLKDAYKRDRRNPFAKAFSLVPTAPSRKFATACKVLSDCLSPSSWNSCEVERYFRRVFENEASE